MYPGLCLSLLLAMGSLCTAAAQSIRWSSARNDSFEVYSDAGASSARSNLEYFERLRLFFLSHTNLNTVSRSPVRIIVFRSEEEFLNYRVRSNGAAYFIGTESRNYIVMPAASAEHLSVAAHEYVHFLLRASSLSLPAWLNEGLPDVFSTVSINEHASSVGGELPGRTHVLRSRKWTPLADLVAVTADSPLRDDRDFESLFYAQSWALTHMLLLSPDYSSRFPRLLTVMASGLPATRAFQEVYAKSMVDLDRDLHAYVAARRFIRVALPGVTVPLPSARFSDPGSIEVRAMLADLVSAAGDFNRATMLFRQLAREEPKNPDFPAALGSIALRQGDRERARREWQRAVQLDIADPVLCYRYAAMAEDAGLPDEQIRPALERALALQPDFDDAHYLLGLIDKRAARYQSALAHLQAVQSVPAKRAYAYWSATADVLVELDLREEAKKAAAKAAEHAESPREKRLASQLAYVAGTDLAVQFTRDSEGRAKLATTRAPHNAPSWNPFIEPGDRIQRAEGTLKEIECENQTIRLSVLTGGGKLTLTLPDPSRVQLRNIPADSFEFTCGPQQDRRITVEYNEAGLVRGIEFH